MEGYDCDAAASTIKIEDITSDKYNRDILRKLKGNDPELVELVVCKRGDFRGGNYYCPENARDFGWLGYFIGKNTSLRELCLYSNPFRYVHNRADAEEFFRGVNSNRSFQKITFTMDLMGGEIFQSLRPFFENNNIAELVVYNCVFGAGCAHQLSLALRVCNKSLKSVTIRYTPMGNERLVDVIEAMGMHPQLEYLALPSMNIGRNECNALANVLKSKMAALQELYLYNNNIDDDGVDALVGALTNSRLTVLDLVGNNRITVEGLSIFSKVLCDTSSINNTFLSNHALESLGSLSAMPGDVASLLYLNRSEDKKQVAMKKIINHHQHFDMQPFFEWDLKVLPTAISWFERAQSIDENNEAGIDKQKLGAIYQFISAMPEIFEPTPAQQREKKGREVAIETGL